MIFLLYCLILLVLSEVTRNENLCSFKKSKNTCMCIYETDLETAFPYIKADCSRMELEFFPRDDELQDVNELDLSHNMITTVDPFKNSFQNAKVRSVNLAFNKISYIAQDFFQNTPNLLRLDLSHNEIVNFLNANVFRGLTKLKSLNFGFNRISTLPDGIFFHLQNLEELDMRNNYLGSLMMDIKNLFKSKIDLNPNITSLKLDGLGISHLQYEFFDGATKLKHLSLSNNPLEVVPTVPYSLDYLDVSGSNISYLAARNLNYHSLKMLKLNRLLNLEKIEHYAFYNLQGLQELEMNDCRNLKELNDLAFGVLSHTIDWSLKKISLARNGFKKLNYTYLRLFSKLDYIDLSSNPWVCDCDILWFQELNGSLYKDDNIRCLSPFYLVNRKIMNLTENDVPGCIETDNVYQKILISILGAFVVILVVLIVYLMYLGPFHTKNLYRGIGVESPYHGNTIMPNAEFL